MKREDDGPDFLNRFPNGTHQRESRSANEKVGGLRLEVHFVGRNC